MIAEWSAALLGLALTRPALRAYPGHIAWAALKRWQAWRPLLAVNRDIFLRSLALQLVFLLITVQGARLGEATVAANALLLNGLLLTAYALDGLAHAVEALCGHAIGARDHTSLRRALVVACGWSLITSVGFAVLFLLGGICSSTCRPISTACGQRLTRTCRTWRCCRWWRCGVTCWTGCSSAPRGPGKCAMRCWFRW